MVRSRLRSSSVIIALASAAIFLAGCLYMAAYLPQRQAQLDEAAQQAAAQSTLAWQALLDGKLSDAEIESLVIEVEQLPFSASKGTTSADIFAGWIILFCMAVAAIASLWIGLHLDQRMSAMRRTAEEIIETGNLSRRLPVDSRWDDLSRINSVLNGLFERLQSHISAVEALSNNLAHDLRMPMSRLKARLEALPESSERGDLLADVDELLGVFQALLRLTELDSGQARRDINEQNLTAIVSDAVEFYAPVAETKNIDIHHALDPCTWPVDRHLLFQALTNLLDNAVKFTPDGGLVFVELAFDQERDQVTLSVSDSGPGVPLQTHSQLAQRFYRGEESRTTPGHGLGLAMVQAIADVHHAALTFTNGGHEDRLSGLKVTLEFARPI